jgi:hypothetical protein
MRPSALQTPRNNGGFGGGYGGYGNFGGGAGGYGGGDVRPGDWTCPTCSANVFASKSECFKCRLSHAFRECFCEPVTVTVASELKISA